MAQLHVCPTAETERQEESGLLVQEMYFTQRKNQSMFHNSTPDKEHIVCTYHFVQ